MCHAPSFHCAVSRSEGTSICIAGSNGGVGWGGNGFVAVKGGHGPFPVLFRVFADALADGLQVLRGQLGEELASGLGR